VTLEGGAKVHKAQQSLCEVLRRKADASPERLVFTFLTYDHGGQVSTQELSYGDLLHRAQAIGGRLREVCAVGDRAMILCQPGPDYIAAFYGCVMAGVVAVPTNPPRNAKHMERIKGILSDAGASAILTSDDLIARMAPFVAGDQMLPPLIEIGAIDAGHADAWVDPKVGPDALAFLQYTSGTTGTPKGVMVPHWQLLNNVENIVDMTGLNPSSTMVAWAPPYHDMGLIGGLITGVCTSFPTVLMAPMSFIGRPVRWLEAISDARATLTTGPGFAYQLCVDQVADEDVARLDLSSLRTALIGADRVRYDTMRAFCEKFAPAGFRADSFHPGYGMAETVLIATGRRRRGRPKSYAIDPAALRGGQVEIRRRIAFGARRPSSVGQERIVTTCGRPIKGHTLRIVDPETKRACPDGGVGEIWVTGPSVTAGYWNDCEATRETFEAHLIGDAGNEPVSGQRFLRTGDLGALIDGEIWTDQGDDHHPRSPSLRAGHRSHGRRTVRVQPGWHRRVRAR
jgi:acyl-CoA synthetase (AMP-forming)/AMP-acid ligase II